MTKTKDKKKCEDSGNSQRNIADKWELTNMSYLIVKHCSEFPFFLFSSYQDPILLKGHWHEKSV
jgi:hypothetical protein